MTAAKTSVPEDATALTGTLPLADTKKAKPKAKAKAKTETASHDEAGNVIPVKHSGKATHDEAGNVLR